MKTEHFSERKRKRKLEIEKSVVSETNTVTLISNSAVGASSSTTFSSQTHLDTQKCSFSINQKVQENHHHHHHRKRKRKNTTLQQRQWTYSSADFSNCKDRLIFASYNILGVQNAWNHPQLYRDVSPEFMDWNYRKRLLCKEISGYTPGIICFQEVDRFDDLKYMLGKEGYKAVFKARTGDASDGCAIFWNDELFTLQQEESIEFERSGLRNNVAQLCVFRMNPYNSNQDTYTEHPESSRYFLVGNIHVLFNPSRGDVKLGQVRILLENAERMSMEWGGIPIVLGGDLNSMPLSAMYEFLTSSKVSCGSELIYIIYKLDVLLHDRRQISGSICPLEYSPRFQHSRHRWSDQELRLATGSAVRYVTHPLKLFSAYAGVPGSARNRDSVGEPLATSFHSKFIGTVDYIWHTKELLPVRVLEPLPLGMLKIMGGLPNMKWGSDHLAVVCELAFADNGNAPSSSDNQTSEEASQLA